MLERNFLTDAKHLNVVHLNVVEKSAFTDILGKAAWYLHICLVQACSRV